jgi:predicted component of type VI protein secretion system
VKVVALSPEAQNPAIDIPTTSGIVGDLQNSNTKCEVSIHESKVATNEKHNNNESIA